MERGITESIYNIKKISILFNNLLSRINIKRVIIVELQKTLTDIRNSVINCLLSRIYFLVKCSILHGKHNITIFKYSSVYR